MKVKTIYIAIALFLGGTFFSVSEMIKGREGFFREFIPVDTPKEIRKFNQNDWAIKTDDGYPYRAAMLDDVVFNKRIRALKKDSLMVVLGRPDRKNENYLYYLIDQNRIGFWPLNTKTMVIKLSDSLSIEWIKIHE